MKRTSRLYGEQKQYKVTRSIKQKQQETQTDSKHTQVMLCAESEFVENIEEFLNVITPKNTSFQILMKQMKFRTYK